MSRLSTRLLALGLLVATAVPGVGTQVAQADPPVQSPFPVPPPRVFCFRVTDIEQDPADDNRFTFQFEYLNWTNKPAYGAYIWVNTGTRTVLGGPPTIVGAGVDPDGRGGPPGGSEIGAGIYNIPAHQSGRGRGDIPGHLNDWSVVFRGNTSVYWGDPDGPGVGADVTPIPYRSLMNQPNSASQFAQVPGLGPDGLLIKDSAIDGGPPVYGPPTQPAPFPAGGVPLPDGSGNVLDGFSITVDDFEVGEVLSMNWMLADENGQSIGQVGAGGNVVGDQMGFGLFNLTRVTPGASMPPGVFLGNSGFTQGVNFFPNVWRIPDPNDPEGDALAEFGVEFGAALVAPPLDPNPGGDVPPTVIIPIPDVSPGVNPPNTELPGCPSMEPLGDANGNGVVNVADNLCILLVATWELGGESGSAPGCWVVPLAQIDIDCDASVTVIDVQLSVYFSLGLGFSTAADGNGNECHDNCECSESACDDTNPCTVDRCGLTGLCVHDPVGCNDGDPCTIDMCEPEAGGCTSFPVGCGGAPGCFILDGAPCDDGNACTDIDECFGGACDPGSALDCNDSNPCTDDSCDTEDGCVNAPKTDGTSCGGSDICVSGQCVTPTGCTTNADCNTGGNACVTYRCQASATLGVNQCVVDSTLNCNNGNPCTIDSCNPATGCVHVNTDTPPCDDNSACTTNDHCDAGECVGDLNDCDDNNPCSIDHCDPLTGCWGQAINSGACDDGNACTENTECVVGFCVGDTVACDDTNVCTTDTCNPSTGCVFTPDTCDDGNPCTDVTCDGVLGCTYPPLTGPVCNDGNNCTIDDQCTAGTCGGTEVLGCGGGAPVVCALSGTAGEFVSCPIRIASLQDAFPRVASFQADFTYSATAVSLVTLRDGTFCAPSTFNCQMNMFWDIPDVFTSLQAGHTVFLNPTDPLAWTGTGRVFLLHFSNPATPVADAYLDSGANQIVGDDLVVELIFEMQQTVPASSPVLVSASNIAAVSANVQELPVQFFGDLIMFTGDE